VIVESAHWSTGRTYDLLVEAVVGATERELRSGGNCYSFDVKKPKAMFTLCNTFGRVAVALPGNNHMNMAFKSSNGEGV
jgi:hypothetical protein